MEEGFIGDSGYVDWERVLPKGWAVREYLGDGLRCADLTRGELCVKLFIFNGKWAFSCMVIENDEPQPVFIDNEGFIQNICDIYRAMQIWGIV